MSIAGGIAIYFILWWIAFMLVLPFGVRNAAESGTVPDAGHDPGAPLRPRLVVKMAAASVLAALFWLAAWAVITRSGLTLDDVSLFRRGGG